ncbi:helix-turn-helix domain-containing protein [Streptomyces agglomeratus]|uniref:helix-turn-helix domain-containing protein n=1 Tax=Streptomyces agglomeratus TaxID=285458 RepID=UPI003F741D9F
MAALAEGRDREDVAAVFRVSLKAVDGWWAKWQAGGRDALVARPRGKRVGEHQVLSEAEQAAVRQPGQAGDEGAGQLPPPRADPGTPGTAGRGRRACCAAGRRWPPGQRPLRRAVRGAARRRGWSFLRRTVRSAR